MLRPLIKDDAITRYRRYLSFSLRTLFILLTASAVWLGIVVNRAREQREAVKAIEALGGTVFYDWQQQYLPNGYKIVARDGTPVGPAWLRKIIGDDFFQTVTTVIFASFPKPTDAEVLKAIPQFQRLQGLEGVAIPYSASEVTLDKVAAALPKCKIDRY